MKIRYAMRAALLAGAALSMGAMLASPAAAQEAPRDYSMAPQALGDALRSFAIDSGVDVVFDPAVVRGKRTRGLVGRHSPEEAVRLLLAGTGLVAQRNAAGGYTILRPAEQPVHATQASSEEQEEIVVTGTNLRGSKPTSPLIVLTRKNVEESGATSVEDFMRKIPQNFSGGVGDENFFANQPGVDRSDHGSGLNLRGLGQRATLVLLNGRRLAPGGGGGAFVDVSLIPATAIDRVEILTDGASAIYGSDAVGGVVNLILRDRFEGVEASALAGSATHGDGDQLQLGLTAGHAWNGGHAMLSYEYRLEDEILVKDRDFSLGRRPGTFLLPRERRHSLFGVVQQKLADGLTLDLNGSYGERRTERTYFYVDSALPIGVDQKARQINLSGEIRYDIGGSWLLRAEGLYSRIKTDNLQTQPGGDELVNSRAIDTEIYGFGLKLDGSLFDLPGGPVKVGAGSEIRWENYADHYKSAAGGRDLASSRSVKSAFGELLVPLFSEINAAPGLAGLQLSAAARYEDYGRLGSSFDPKLGLLWSPFPALALRASYGTSFRAPLLAETAGFFNLIYVPGSLIYVDPAQAKGVGLFLQGSNPDIRPESSKTWTFGGELSPRALPGLTLSANYYSIRFSDRIAAPLTKIAVIGDPSFEPLVVRNPSLAQVQGIVDAASLALDFTGMPGGAKPADVTVILDGRTGNTSVTTTSGFDIGLNYAFAAGSSKFVLSANANHIIRYKDQLTATSPKFSNFDIPYRPLDFRARAGLSWSRASLGGSFFVNYAGAYRDNRTAVERQVDSFATIDAGLTYSFRDGPLKGTRLALFVENLLDTDPPFLAPDPGSTVGSGYDPVNASGKGRFVSLQLRKSW